MKGMVQSVESQSKCCWISSKAVIPTVRSEQRPDKQLSIFACVVAEQCSEPEWRIGWIVKSEVLGRRRVTLVGWTINLHANSAAANQWVDRGEIWPFVEELERRLQEPVTVATVDWIWDEYARITTGGRLYGERYRPTQSPELQHVQPGVWGIRVQ
jgi:hypothetical protein